MSNRLSMKSIELWVLATMLPFLFACGVNQHPFRIEKADPKTRRTLPSGEIIGGEGRYGSYAWLGIRYAEPPVGELRWRDPLPAKPWTGRYEALSFGEACPQYTSKIGGVIGPKGTVVGNEDCLTLNVFSPKIEVGALPENDARLPVMVWIHGGGNSIGAASLYDGGHLASTQKVIVVTVQYRLGPLGWFRHEALRDFAKTDTEKSGNFGTLDMLLALRWVRDNIAGFGGNPDNVTIFGESAGGRNVYSLLISPPAKGLFHRAISQSGGAYCSSDAEAENPSDAAEPGSSKSSAEILLSLLQKDFQFDRDAAKRKMAGMTPAEIDAYFRSKTAYQILESVKPNHVALYPQLFADGAVISSECWRGFEKPDGWNRVPVMTGTTRDEARLFMFNDTRFIKHVFGILPRFIDEEHFLKGTDFLTRFMKQAVADLPAAAMKTSEKDVFVYRFDWDEEPTVAGADLSKMFGAAHGIEVPFVFGHFNFGAGDAERIFTDENLDGRLAVSKAMMAYWGEFARTGNPGRGTPGDLPEWSSFDASKQQMIFDTPKGGGVRLETSRDTEETIASDLSADKTLGVEFRCEIEMARVYMGWGYTSEKYSSISECKPYPFRIRSDL